MVEVRGACVEGEAVVGESSLPRFLRLCLEVHKGIEWNDYKGMEMNVFKQGKWMEKNGMEWN